MSDDINLDDDDTIVTQITIPAAIGTPEEPDTIPSLARAVFVRARAFLCRTVEDYEFGIKQIKLLKRKRRQWKEFNAKSLAAAKEAYETKKAEVAVVDDNLDGAEEAFYAQCEEWAAARRALQRAAAVETVRAMTPSPTQLAEHYAARRDHALANGDTVKVGRIDYEASQPAAMQSVVLPPPDAPPSADALVPKVDGVSLTTPYTYEILDENKLDRKYLMPDRKKIAGIVRTMKADAQELLGPGVLVRPDTALRVRER
jgi:hypothetical protein